MDVLIRVFILSFIFMSFHSELEAFRSGPDLQVAVEEPIDFRSEAYIPEVGSSAFSFVLRNPLGFYHQQFSQNVNWVRENESKLLGFRLCLYQAKHDERDPGCAFFGMRQVDLIAEFGLFQYDEQDGHSFLMTLDDLNRLEQACDFLDIPCYGYEEEMASEPALKEFFLNFANIFTVYDDWVFYGLGSTCGNEGVSVGHGGVSVGHGGSCQEDGPRAIETGASSASTSVGTLQSSLDSASGCSASSVPRAPSSGFLIALLILFLALSFSRRRV